MGQSIEAKKERTGRRLKGQDNFRASICNPFLLCTVHMGGTRVQEQTASCPNTVFFGKKPETIPRSCIFMTYSPLEDTKSRSRELFAFVLQHLSSCLSPEKSFTRGQLLS